MSANLASIHSNFVSNYNGSSPSDVFLAILPGPLCIPLISLLLPILLPQRFLRLPFASRIWFHVSIEICLTFSLLLSFTLLSDYNILFPVNLLVLIGSLIFLVPPQKHKGSRNIVDVLSLRLSERKPPFLTNYRAGVNIATTLAILAVDFPIFPRRFVKTETYGYSLMDVGVGCFIVINGLSGSVSSKSGGIATAWKKSSAMFFLGLFRLVAVKLSGYHEHVTEYGVHWNFFFTLACIKFLSTINTLKIRPCVTAVILLVVQKVLLKLGLESWILSDYPRNDVISANREGIFSLIGYLALYYAAMEIGDYIKRPKSLFKEWIHLSTILTSLSVAGWMTLQYFVAILGNPSRRLANASFCFWMLTYNTTIMAVFSIADLLLVFLEFRRGKLKSWAGSDHSQSTEGRKIENIPSPRQLPVTREPYLMVSINDNGMTYFLLANVVTGLVNFLFDTIHAHWFSSVIILSAYCFSLTIPVVIMYLWKIRLA